MSSLTVVNSLLQNRYRVVRAIGKGGQGAVYEAIDERLGCKVALKENFFSGAPVEKAFEREARLLAKLFHHSLPKVSDHFIEAGNQYLVMEYVPGKSLAEILEHQKNTFSVNNVLNWADQLLDVIDFLHTQTTPIIHRDVTPRNIKLTEKGRIILLDFGLAKDEDGSLIWGHSKHFAPIEQILERTTDQRSDIYSVAATIYNLLTGVLPPDSDLRNNTVKAGRSDPLRPANLLNSKVKPEVASVLMKAMELNRDDRFASATEMQAALRNAVLPETYVQTPDNNSFLLRSYSLFGYETDGGKESVLWDAPEKFQQLAKERNENLTANYRNWIDSKRQFTVDEITKGTWIKVGDHGYPNQVIFNKDGTLVERPLFSFDENEWWDGSWRLIDGALRMNIGIYELDIVASQNALHSGVEDADGNRNAYFRVFQVK